MSKNKADHKMLQLLNVVIENYLTKGDPIGSKFLHSIDTLDYAPSTLRKYLNILEKEGLVYQSYNNSGRIPTLDGLSQYLEELIAEEMSSETTLARYQQADIQIDKTRNSLRLIVETLGNVVDGVMVGFINRDEYRYLGINNLLKYDKLDDMDLTRTIIKFIEEKELIQSLDEKICRKGEIYYSFVEYNDQPISVLYTKIHLNGYDAMIAIIGPVRVDYRHNLGILRDFIDNNENNI